MTSFCKRAALALIILPLAIACNQPKSSDTTPAAKADTAAPAAAPTAAADPQAAPTAEPAKPQTVCEKYAAAVCAKIGDETAYVGG